MPVRYVCDYCNKFEFESEDGQLVQQKMLEHTKTHRHNLFEDIQEFHTKFELPPLDKPGFLSIELMRFRINFIREELQEFIDAWDSYLFNENNTAYPEYYAHIHIEQAFDALIDLTYVTLGTAYLMGLPFNDGWKEVHHCNMQKVRAKIESDSKRGSTYDVVKPEGWQAPNLEKFIGDK